MFSRSRCDYVAGEKQQLKIAGNVWIVKYNPSAVLS